MKTLNHDVFSISYPDNWQVYGDQTSAITIAPQGAISQNAIAYGAIVSVYQPERSEAGLDNNTHELIGTLKQSNPDLRQIGRDEDIRVNGALGKSSDLIGVSPIKDSQSGTTRERDWLVTFQRQDGSLLYIHGINTSNVPTVWQERRKDVCFDRRCGFGDRHGITTRRGHLEQRARSAAEDDGPVGIPRAAPQHSAIT